jgi:hypothetical protein
MADSTPDLSANFRDKVIKAGALRLSDATSRSTTDYAEIIVVDGVPSGAYGRDSDATMVALRKDATSADAAVYITVNGGTAWSPAQTTGAGGTQADLIFDAATELTIAAGAITATQGYHTIDTEADAASDDLDSLAGGTAGEVVVVRAASAARTVVLKHGVGANLIACIGGRDISLAEANDAAILVYNGTQWVAFGSTLLDNILGVANTWSAEQTFAGGIALLDSDNVTLGAGDDDTIAHDGTLTTWTHTTGDLVIDNTDVDDQIILRVGTDTAATGVEIRNNSDVAVFSVVPASASTGTTLVVGVLDLNGTLDQDAALTGTGDAANIAATINHASQVAEALDVSIAQITNVRTSGSASAVRASITSLSGDTAGVDYNAFEAAVTVGEAAADHIVLKQGVGFDRTIDSSAAGTGEVVWFLPDAVANALTIEDSAGNDFLVIDTVAVDGMTFGNAATNPVFTFLGSGATSFAGAVTTTDGVAGGTARKVGGKVFGTVADATHVDPAGAGDAAETVVSTYSIPASSIKSGTKIRVDFAYVVTTGATIETLVMRLRLGGVGGTVVAASTSMDPATGSGSGYAILVGHAVPGAAAEIAHFGVVKDFAAAGSDSAVAQLGPTLTNFATNGALDLVLTADFGVAEAAGGDTVAVRIFEVEMYG